MAIQNKRQRFALIFSIGLLSLGLCVGFLTYAHGIGQKLFGIYSLVDPGMSTRRTEVQLAETPQPVGDFFSGTLSTATMTSACSSISKQKKNAPSSTSMERMNTRPQLPDIKGKMGTAAFENLDPSMDQQLHPFRLLPPGPPLIIANDGLRVRSDAGQLAFQFSPEAFPTGETSFSSISGDGMIFLRVEAGSDPVELDGKTLIPGAVYQAIEGSRVRCPGNASLIIQGDRPLGYPSKVG